jgi:YD repeat-containing protein
MSRTEVCGSTRPQAEKQTFAYDGLGDRIRETGPSGSNTDTNTYVASGDAMLYMKNVVGSTTSKTV